MWLTIKEFFYKWRLRVAEARVYANTQVRKELIRRHQEQQAKVERIKAKLAELE